MVDSGGGEEVGGEWGEVLCGAGGIGGGDTILKIKAGVNDVLDMAVGECDVTTW